MTTDNDSVEVSIEVLDPNSYEQFVDINPDQVITVDPEEIVIPEITTSEETPVLLESTIDDSWFLGGLTVYKKVNLERYEIATNFGTDATNRYKPGDYIITSENPQRRYILTPDQFSELKDDYSEGVCTTKKTFKIARLADHDGVVILAVGGSPMKFYLGQDYILMNAPGDYSVLRREIFLRHYVIVNT